MKSLHLNRVLPAEPVSQPQQGDLSGPAPFCSVVVPVYNKGAFLRDALLSVLGQVYRDFELVVVDDGSTDDSAAIARCIQDPRVRVFSRANGGVSAARNEGIQRSRGELVFFFDADDWMHPDYLKIQVTQSIREPRAHMYAARFLRFPSDLARPVCWPLEAVPAGRLVFDLPAEWFRGQTFITSTVAIRRSALVAFQPCFPLGESKGEDMDLWFRVAEQGPVCMTDLALVAYREGGPGSLSQQRASLALPAYLARMSQRARTGAMSATLARSTLRLVAELSISHARNLLRAGRRGSALQVLMRTAGKDRRRWWMTLLMAGFFPTAVIDRRERQRIARTQQRLE